MHRPDAETVRSSVSEQYARAVADDDSSSAPKSCCGPSAIPRGTAAKLAGYDPESLAALPADAVESSFGCGNPVALAEVQTGDVVLDLGSGAGIDLLLAAARTGSEGRAIGIDMTDEMLARARTNIQEAGFAHAEVRKGIIEELPVEDGTVDVVLSNCVINLSPEKPRVFSEIARVLKPGGRFSVADIVVEDLPEWLLALPEAWSACVSGAIPQEDYVAGLQAAGLEDVQVVDRLVYDPEQVIALVESDLEDLSDKLTAAGLTPEVLKARASELEGKVASIRVTGRRPVTASGDGTAQDASCCAPTCCD